MSPSGVRFELVPSADADYGEIAEVAETLDGAAPCPVAFTLRADADVDAQPVPRVACDAAALAEAP